MLANFFKKQSVGFFVTLATFVVGIFGMIIYFVGCGSIGYFQEGYVANTTLFIFLGLGALLIALLLSQVKGKGMLDRIISILRGAMMVGSSIFFMAAMMYFIYDRSEGFGYIYGSNPEILTTIQTPENMLSAGLAITTIVFLGITVVAIWVATFFSLSTKKEETVEARAK